MEISYPSEVLSDRRITYYFDGQQKYISKDVGPKIRESRTTGFVVVATHQSYDKVVKLTILAVGVTTANEMHLFDLAPIQTELERILTGVMERTQCLTAESKGEEVPPALLQSLQRGVGATDSGGRPSLVVKANPDKPLTLIIAQRNRTSMQHGAPSVTELPGSSRANIFPGSMCIRRPSMDEHGRPNSPGSPDKNQLSSSYAVPNKFWELMEPYCAEITETNINHLEGLIRSYQDVETTYLHPPTIGCAIIDTSPTAESPAPKRLRRDLGNISTQPTPHSPSQTHSKILMNATADHWAQCLEAELGKTISESSVLGKLSQSLLDSCCRDHLFTFNESVKKVAVEYQSTAGRNHDHNHSPCDNAPSNLMLATTSTCSLDTPTSAGPRSSLSEAPPLLTSPASSTCYTDLSTLPSDVRHWVTGKASQPLKMLAKQLHVTSSYRVEKKISQAMEELGLMPLNVGVQSQTTASATTPYSDAPILTQNAPLKCEEPGSNGSASDSADTKMELKPPGIRLSLSNAARSTRSPLPSPLTAMVSPSPVTEGTGSLRRRRGSVGRGRRSPRASVPSLQLTITTTLEQPGRRRRSCCLKSDNEDDSATTPTPSDRPFEVAKDTHTDPILMNGLASKPKPAASGYHKTGKRRGRRGSRKYNRTATGTVCGPYNGCDLNGRDGNESLAPSSRTTPPRSFKETLSNGLLTTDDDDDDGATSHVGSIGRRRLGSHDDEAMEMETTAVHKRLERETNTALGDHCDRQRDRRLGVCKRPRDLSPIIMDNHLTVNPTLPLLNGGDAFSFPHCSDTGLGEEQEEEGDDCQEAVNGIATTNGAEHALLVEAYSTSVENKLPIKSDQSPILDRLELDSIPRLLKSPTNFTDCPTLTTTVLTHHSKDVTTLGATMPPETKFSNAFSFLLNEYGRERSTWDKSLLSAATIPSTGLVAAVAAVNEARCLEGPVVDEVALAILQRQQELRVVCAENHTLLRRLIQAARRDMQRQEIQRRLAIADADVIEAYNKLESYRPQRKIPLKRDRDVAHKALKERHKLIKELEAFDAKSP